MQQSSLSSNQNRAHHAPVVLNPANQSWANGQSGPPSLRLETIIICSFALITFVLGSIFVLIGLSTWTTNNELNNSGITTSAKVVDANDTISNRGFPHHTLTYSFTVDGTKIPGKPGVYQKNVDVTTDFYKVYQVGSYISIRYLPSNPTISDILAFKDSSVQYLVFIVMSVLFYGIAVILGWFLIKRRQLFRLLKQRGQILTGYLLSSKVVQARGAKGSSSLRVEYWFTNPQGIDLRGKQSFGYTLVYHNTINLQVNAPITIVYADPKHYQVL